MMPADSDGGDLAFLDGGPHGLLAHAEQLGRLLDRQGQGAGRIAAGEVVGMGRCHPCSLRELTTTPFSAL